MISINNLRCILIFLLLTCINLSVYNQCNRFENAQKKGVIIKEKSYFNKYAVLLQDTCTTYNRFTNNLIYPNLDYDTSTLKSIIIDETLFLKTEKYIYENFSESYQLSFFYRLYIGCVDKNSDTCIIVQFIKEKDFNKDKSYLKQMNLIIGGNKPLYLAYFLLKNNKIYLLRKNIPPVEPTPNEQTEKVC
ncbi:MAG: hypothetical protein LBN27_04190 [Prevotellaceae bacterium]|jgi:hypothetical protein|nr:hypothetical protein [Prevotellaceae bacterium]